MTLRLTRSNRPSQSDRKRRGPGPTLRLNVEGDTVARCVGFFAGARFESTFVNALMPPDMHTFDHRRHSLRATLRVGLTQTNE
jgi:hypothetical protein